MSKDKFKIGDTVYLKAEIVGFDKNDDTYETYVDGGRRRLWFLDSVFITKEEMLEELQKPEMPKVGEVYKQSDCENANIVAVTDHNVFFEFDDKDCGSVCLTYFFANYRKVES